MHLLTSTCSTWNPIGCVCSLSLPFRSGQSCFKEIWEKDGGIRLKSETVTDISTGKQWDKCDVTCHTVFVIIKKLDVGTHTHHKIRQPRLGGKGWRNTPSPEIGDFYCVF